MANIETILKLKLHYSLWFEITLVLHMIKLKAKVNNCINRIIPNRPC